MISTSFLVGLVLLLIVPGPTNTLLATAGATTGLSSAFRLLVAEVLAYLLAVALLGYALAPLIAHSPHAGSMLQVAAALYLVRTAWRLWRVDPGLSIRQIVTGRVVFTTTLMNPKSLVIAFGLMPTGWTLNPDVALSHLLAMAAIIPFIGGLWLLAGCLGTLSMGSVVARGAPRVSAMAIGLFAILLARSAFAGG